MKRLLLTILALVAMTTGAWAQTDYGFEISGVKITSQNYQAQASSWHYDPVANVLHLEAGGLLIPWSVAAPIYVKGDINPTLNICLDGDFTIRGQYLTGIIFAGSGHHTIYGNGTLTMTSEVIDPKMIVANDNTSHLTIKDVTCNMTAYGDHSVGIVNNFASLTFDNCEVNINAGYAAVIHNDTGGSGNPPIFVKCFLANGYKDSSFWEYYGGPLLKEAHIKRTINSVSVTVEAPEIGNTPSTNIVTDSEDYYATIVEWYAGWRLPDDYIFSEGETYMVSFILKPTEGNRFWDKKDEVTAYVNGHPATVYSVNGGYLTIQYTFPALTDTYDLWIAGTQVTKQNKDDILGDGKVTFDMNTSTLTLQNANISLSGNDGITSKVPDLKIKVLGQNSITIANSGRGVSIDNDSGDGSVTFLGDGSLHVKSKGDAGIRSNIDVVLKDGVKIITESKQNSSIRGWKSTSSAPWPSLTMYGDKTILMAWKGLSSFHALNLNDGLSITRPAGATFVADQGVRVGSNSVQNEWVVIGDLVRGDANFDGVIDIADVTAVLTAMANNSNDPQYRVNDDDAVDIADVTAILTIMAGQ